MSGALAIVLSGWLCAAALAGWTLALRRRLRLVALADHELRGPVTALSLAAEALRRRGPTRTSGAIVAGQVERLRIALEDLAAARSGRRASGSPEPVHVGDAARGIAAGFALLANRAGRRMRGRWPAAPLAVRIDPGRFAQALGNVLANAVEHGSGDVAVATARQGDRVRVEVSDEGSLSLRRAPRGRGNGLRIARRAAEEAGGRLSVSSGPDGTKVVIDLPVLDEADPPPEAA